MNIIDEETPQSLDRLYLLLPVVYRQRDEELGGPLRELLRVIGEQVTVVEDDIRQLYENWFIETCEDWVVPYIGELIGYQPVHEAGEPGDASTAQGRLRNRMLIPRREVATTIQSRRRRGTPALLEELARDAADWPSRAVEFFRLLNFAQAINSPHLGRGRTVDLRKTNALDLLDGPFDKLSHNVDVRRIVSRFGIGRYNLPNIGLFVWRLKEYPVSVGQSACLEEDGMPHAYTFSFLGNDAPLFARTLPETDPTQIADEPNLPVPIRRLAFERDVKSAQARKEKASRFYGEGKSLQLFLSDENGGRTPVPVELDRIVPADLSDWNRYRPPQGSIAVDPVLGRIAFHPEESPSGVWASYYYGFSADIGGGQYHRPLRQPGQTGRFTELDFKNLADLAKKLKAASGPLDKYVSKRLSPETASILKDYDGSDPVPDDLRKKLVPSLIEDLNRELFDEKLYDEERFVGVTMSPEILHEVTQLVARLLEGKLGREEVGRLNRILFEQTYKDEIAEYIRLYRVGEGAPYPSIDKAIERWGKDNPRCAIIEIIDNGVYSDPLEIRLARGQSLQIRAADRRRPIIYLHEQYKNRPEWLSVRSKSGGCFILDGILVAGRSMRVDGEVEEVRIRHCTLVPGWGLTPACDPKRPAKPSLELYKTDCRVIIEHSIVGSIQIFKDEVLGEPLEIDISDSVLDATGNDREALGAPGWPRAHAALRIARSTVIGQIETNSISLAEDSIFTGKLTVTRRQTGCVRFCYVPHESRTPRRYNCQPDLVEAAVRLALPKPEQADQRDQALHDVRQRVEPQFSSVRYGRPAYCQLAVTCASEITGGAGDESEMGVFHDLFQPQRAANLRARLDESMPAGSEAGIIFAS
jgi:hypothetical protein